MYPGQSHTAVLSKREEEVLKLIGKGRTSKEIAFQLKISKETVSSHRKRICHKIGIHSTSELIAYALRQIEVGDH